MTRIGVRDTAENATDTWAALLGDVLAAFGEDSRTYQGNWPLACLPYEQRLRSLVLAELERSDAWLHAPVSPKQAIGISQWGPPNFVATACVRPVDMWFLREGKPWHQPPQDGQGGPFYLVARFWAARASSLDDYFVPPQIDLQLHISYELCEPFRWLLREWHRVLVLLLGWNRVRPCLNGSAPKGFLGNDALREVELYLDDPGKDPAFAFTFTIRAETPVDEITRAFAVYNAIWDALHALTVPRCDPERLHKHFLALRCRLSGVPFRDSFYDPGIDIPKK